MSTFYLMIDDGPSSRAKEKLEYLAEKGITAVWFLIGRNIEQNKQAAIDAIRRGHVLGNHSYSHPYFPLTSMAAIREEICKTELLIDEVYASAGVARPAKVFRFPYGARGGLFKRLRLNRMLEEFGFQGGPFETFEYGLRFRNKPGDRFWMWSYDVREWALGVGPIRKLTFEQVSERLEKYLDAYSQEKDQLILMHDHEYSHKAFSRLLQQFLDRGITFAPARELIPSPH